MEGLRSQMRPKMADLKLERAWRAYFRSERADLRPERADFRPDRQISGLRGHGGDGWMSGQTNESPPVCDRTSSPSGPLPCLSFRFTTMQSRATGIADYILPLGDLLNHFTH